MPDERILEVMLLSRRDEEHTRAAWRYVLEWKKVLAEAADAGRGLVTVVS